MLIPIDANAVGYACHNATKLSYNGMPTQAIYGFLRVLRQNKVAFPQAKALVLWDGYAKHRFAELPTYKGDRQERLIDPEAAKNKAEYQAQIPVIKKAVTFLGTTQLLHPDYEADDLAGLIVKRYPGEKIRLVTGDSDWWQFVSENVDWYDPRKEGRLVTFTDFQPSTGYFTPGEYLEGKALIGDDTDSIPGIEDIGKKTAMEFIAKWKSVQNFFDAVDSGKYTPATRKSKVAKTPHPEETLASPEGRALFYRNMRLMDLRNVQVQSPELMSVDKSEPDFDKFRTLCDRLGFVSITRNFADWVAPFKT